MEREEIGEASKYIIGSFRGTKSLFGKIIPIPFLRGRG